MSASLPDDSQRLIGEIEGAGITVGISCGVGSFDPVLAGVAVDGITDCEGAGADQGGGVIPVLHTGKATDALMVEGALRGDEAPAAGCVLEPLTTGCVVLWEDVGDGELFGSGYAQGAAHFFPLVG